MEPQADGVVGEVLSPRAAAVVTGVVSTLALGFLVWLVYFNEGGRASGSGSTLPAWNALFNAMAATFLGLGRMAIRGGNRTLHKRLMLSALAASALFLVSYVSYHALHGDTRFAGTGAVRPFYFFILVSHIGLSALVFPAILWSLYLAFSERIAQHKRIARWTWAGWMYVSLTGILIYLMLHVIDWG